MFFLKDQVMQELTEHSCTEDLRERLSSHGFSMNAYYVAAFRPVSDDSDLSALKEIVIEEKQNAYCYRYNNLILNVYFQNEIPSSMPSYIIENCQTISNIASSFLLWRYSDRNQLSAYVTGRISDGSVGSNPGPDT